MMNKNIGNKSWFKICKQIKRSHEAYHSSFVYLEGSIISLVYQLINKALV